MDERCSSMLVLGAGSDIGRALAKVAAAAGCALLLATRNSSQLDDLREVLRQKHGVVAIFEFDVLAIDTHGTFLDSLPILPDMVVCLVGRLGDQTLAEHCFSEADLILRSNLLGPVSILSVVANRMQDAGTVLSLGSVPLPAIGGGLATIFTAPPKPD
jgi:short-subunit dehydrogenase